MHVDGEPVHTDSEIVVRMVSKGLKVFVPSSADLIERKKRENDNIFSALTRWFN
jgi:hypothetical protein